MFTNQRARVPAVITVSAGALAAFACVFVLPAGAADRSAGPSTTARCAVLSPGAASGARRAVRDACRMQGTPYSWGGGHGAEPGPTTGHYNGNPASRSAVSTVGFDCSGLVRWAYAQALGRDVIGRTDTDTYYARALHDGMRHIAPAEGLSGLLPGDLLFYRNAGGVVHHVTMYIGEGKVVQAQRSATEVGVSAADLGREYVGAIRVLAPGTASAPVLKHPAPALPAGLGPGLVRWPHSARKPGTGTHASQGRSRRHAAASPKPARTATAEPRPEPKPKPDPVAKPAPAPAPAPTPKPSGGLNLLGSGGVLDGVTTTLNGLLGGHPHG